MGHASGGSWLSSCIVAFSNFSIQYNFGSIAIALLVMSTSVCTTPNNPDLCRRGMQAPWVQGTAASVVFVGAVVGQLSMGVLGDVVGRGPAMLCTMSISFVAALLQAVAPRGTPNDIYALIIFFRFGLGVGVGGIYPLSATKAVEDSAHAEAESGEGQEAAPSHASTSKKAVASAKGFFWQIPGMMGPYAVSYMLTYSSLSTDAKWRLLLGVGAIPSGIAVLLAALEMHLLQPIPLQLPLPGLGLGLGGEKSRPLAEAADTDGEGEGQGRGDRGSPEDTQDTRIPSGPAAHEHAGNPGAETDTAEGADVIPAPSAPSPSPSPDVPGKLSAARVWALMRTAAVQRKLLATGCCWFVFDVVSYGIGLLAPQILAKITDETADITSNASIRSISGLNLITMGLSVPGIILTILLLPVKGIKFLQIFGFSITALFCLLLGALFRPLADDTTGLFVLFCLLSVSMSVGVAVATYTLPALLFEKQIRTTFNGICAAMGKVGAVVGSYSFGSIAHSGSFGYAAVMLICFALSSAAAGLSHVYVDLPPPSAVLWGREGGEELWEEESGVEVVGSTVGSPAASSRDVC